MAALGPSVEFVALQQALAGRYSLDREIGRGGMGHVYLARDVGLDRPVAIKLLPRRDASRPEVRDQFLQEARTAAKLSHPNIVPIYAVEHTGDFVLFVMAYIDGETLATRIARGPLPVRDATRILREVTWGLAYAHAQGVVHRDVKPDNILLENGTDRALVADFGIAKVRDDAETGAEVRGTPEYMSPEHATGETVDQRSDIYSLGVLAFTMLAGRPPFVSESVPELLAHHIRSPIPSLMEHAPGVPRRLARIVERCLAKDPDDRPRSCEELVETLGGIAHRQADAPPAIRAFIADRKERSANALLLVVAIPWVIWPIASLLLFSTPPIRALGFALLASLLAYPAVHLLRSVRRVISSGYTREDLVRGLEIDCERRAEELAHLFGRDFDDQAQRYRRSAMAWLGGALGTVIVVGTQAPGVVWPILGALGAATVGLFQWRRTTLRSDRNGLRRLRFWKGRLAKWLFTLAGWRAEVPDGAGALTHRPTELAIGAVVEGLFESLPKETRQSLGDLPSVVSALEADAQRMREAVDDIDALLGSAPDGDEDVRSRLLKQRDAARVRLEQAVAAIENLRIDLLRLRAGQVRVDGVTANLGNARDLAHQIDRLLEGHAETDQLLAN